MHTIELLEQALAIAEQMGYQIRQEWLGGVGGGVCEYGGRKWIFVDLALTAVEQLEQVTEVLRIDSGIYTLDLPHPMRSLLGIRRAA
jgi:hypothetical protein